MFVLCEGWNKSANDEGLFSDVAVAGIFFVDGNLRISLRKSGTKGHLSLKIDVNGARELYNLLKGQFDEEP